MFSKSPPKKSHDNLIYCGCICNQHINKVTSHFTFMRRAQNAIPMYSNSKGCPKMFPLSAPVLYWFSHLTCISSLKAKKGDFFFTQLKISRYNQHFFAVFRRIFINLPPTYLLQSDLFTHFYIFSWQHYAVFWHLSNFQLQIGQFYGCVSHISKDMVP